MAKGDLSVHTASCSWEWGAWLGAPLHPGGPGSAQGQPGIGVCTAVLPGAHELARGKGAWSSVLQGWLAVWVGGERCVRVGPADGCEESYGGAVWGGEAAGRAEPVRAAPAAVVSPRKLSLLVGRLPTPHLLSGCPFSLGLFWALLSTPGSPLYPQGPLSKSGVPSSSWVLFSYPPPEVPSWSEVPSPLPFSFTAVIPDGSC